ncbi:unnamed protein product [Mesocestoides corti]|uniref:Uncharacterized protein n=1 Tax=Mesocestoides corti TaxID=53468 RepID=A0A0R3U5U3_MESCO|nr:unnamed protein product [Mesocestoides corti]
MPKLLVAGKCGICLDQCILRNLIFGKAVAAEGSKKGEEPRQTEPEEQEESRQHHPHKSPSEGGQPSREEPPPTRIPPASSVPVAPSALWLADKSIVLVRFSECFRRGRVIRYDAELNMCVVQLDLTNTVVNKGIEDIFPDDPAIIAAEAASEKAKEERPQLQREKEEKKTFACLSSPPVFVPPDFLGPSSAPPTL